MANTGRIDDIINIPRIQEQINATNSALDSIVERMVVIAKHSEQIKMDFGGLKGTQALTRALHDVAKANTEAEKANKDLNASLAKQAALQEKLNAALAAAKKPQSGGKSDNATLDEQARLQKKLADLKSEEAKETFRLKKEISDLTAERKHEARMMDSIKGSIIDLEKHVKELTLLYDQLGKEDRESANGMKLQAKIHALNTEIRENKVALSNMKANVGNYRQSMEGLGVTVQHNTTLFQKFKNTMQSTFVGTDGNKSGIGAMIATIGGYIAALAGTLYSIKKVIDYNAQLSDAMADVRKTTGMTEAQVHSLNETVRHFDTRTAQNSLMDLGVVAGKLGVPIKEVSGFIRAADQIGVALGRDLGDAEEAVNALGKMVAIFKVNEQFGFETALLKVGSALRMLGNDSTATEENIVEFTKMFGGIGPLAKLNIAQVMGFGATLDQLGQSAEVSATALSQVFLRMFKEQDKFAKVAGVSTKEFSHLLKTDVNEAFILLLQGLNRGGTGLEEVTKKMGFLGTGGRRVAGVLAVLAQHIDILRRSQELSAIEMQKGTALTEQFNIKNTNMAASIDKLAKAWKNFLANSGTIGFFTNLIDALAASFRGLADSLSDDPMVRLQDSLKFWQSQRKIGGGEYGENSAVASNVKSIKEQIRLLQIKRDIEAAEMEKQKEKNKLLQENIAIEKSRYGNAQVPFTPEITPPGVMTQGIPLAPPGTYLTPIETEEEIITRQQVAEAEKAKREAIAAKKKADREASEMEKLNKSAEKLLEKSYEIRVELGMVSLEQQEKHEKDSLQKRIDEINADGLSRIKTEKQIQEELAQVGDPIQKAAMRKELEATNALAKEKIISWEDTNKMKEAITLKYIDKANDIEKAAADKMKTYMDTVKQKLTETARIAELSDITKLSTKKLADREDIRGQLMRREITIKEFKRREKEINEQYDADILQSTITASEKLIGVIEEYNKKALEKGETAFISTLDLENKIAEAKIAISNKVEGVYEENNAKRIEDEKRANELLKEKSMELFRALGSLVSTYYDAQAAQIDGNLSKNKDAWDKELAAAKGNEKLEAQINRRRAAEEESLNKQKKKILHDQAVVNKAFAIADATINTAVAVTAVMDIPIVGQVLAILVALTGAAEIATIIATPIPEYAKGRKTGQAEYAIVGEKGTEAVKLQNKKTYLTPDTASLTYLPQGAEVIPHEKLIKEFSLQPYLTTSTITNNPLTENTFITNENKSTTISPINTKTINPLTENTFITNENKSTTISPINTKTINPLTENTFITNENKSTTISPINTKTNNPLTENTFITNENKSTTISPINTKTNNPLTENTFITNENKSTTISPINTKTNNPLTENTFITNENKSTTISPINTKTIQQYFIEKPLIPPLKNDYAFPIDDILKMAVRFSMPTSTAKSKESAPGIFVTVNNPFGKEILSELKKPKIETSITDMGDRVRYQTGNYSLIIRK